ncbi:EthD family reductase [Dyella amyloliquefaciens]|uniref:EthD family reductase n=1 Tax=Dyella amyloliquefaciens TaxID=1770545 RepID=UPI00102E294A|nr:EthD family reductase [Dyella amyloliquefaciens]
MIRVVGFYRWKEGASFDHDYYRLEHMKLTRQVLEPHGLVRLESDRYLSARPPEDGDIVAASNAYFSTLEVAQQAMAATGALLMADVPNYTNLKPELGLCMVTTHE